jgi:hypothetical protein
MILAKSHFSYKYKLQCKKERGDWRGEKFRGKGGGEN